MAGGGPPALLESDLHWSAALTARAWRRRAVERLRQALETPRRGGDRRPDASSSTPGLGGADKGGVDGAAPEPKGVGDGAGATEASKFYASATNAGDEARARVAAATQHQKAQGFSPTQLVRVRALSAELAAFSNSVVCDLEASLHALSRASSFAGGASVHAAHAAPLTKTSTKQLPDSAALVGMSPGGGSSSIGLDAAPPATAGARTLSGARSSKVPAPGFLFAAARAMSRALPTHALTRLEAAAAAHREERERERAAAVAAAVAATAAGGGTPHHDSGREGDASPAASTRSTPSPSARIVTSPSVQRSYSDGENRAGVNNSGALARAAATPADKRNQSLGLAATPSAAGAQDGDPPATVGDELSSAQLESLAMDLASEMEERVLAPIRQWQAALRDALRSVRDLEHARLEIDARRRHVAYLRTTTERLRAKLTDSGGSLGDGSSAESRLDKAFRAQQHKEAKLGAAQSAFESLEADTYEQLAALARDSTLFRSYIDTAIVLQREAYGSLPTPSLTGASMPAADAIRNTTGGFTPVADSDAGSGASSALDASGGLPHARVHSTHLDAMGRTPGTAHAGHLYDEEEYDHYPESTPVGGGAAIHPYAASPRAAGPRYSHISHSPWPQEYHGNMPVDWTESEGEGPTPRHYGYQSGGSVGRKFSDGQSPMTLPPRAPLARRQSAASDTTW